MVTAVAGFCIRGSVSLLDRLGIGRTFRAAKWPRFPGVEVAGQFHPFRADADGPWLGYHIDRTRFDADLRTHAQSLGVHVRHGAHVRRLMCEGNRVLGVALAASELPARWVIDATGRAQWAAADLGLTRRTLSVPLMAWRGQVEGRLPDRRARFTTHGSGWLWTAQTDSDTITWTLLTRKSLGSLCTPPVVAGAPVQLRARGFDVTWRAHRPVAPPGLLLVGDAAAVVDPAAGQGVLFGLESGLRAAHIVAACSAAPARTALFLAQYDQWAIGEFERKTRALTGMYRDLGIDAALAICPPEEKRTPRASKPATS